MEVPQSEESMFISISLQFKAQTLRASTGKQSGLLVLFVALMSITEREGRSA